jgi:hypothetical protein
MTDDEIDAAYDAAYSEAWRRLGGPIDTTEVQHEACRAVVAMIEERRNEADASAERRLGAWACPLAPRR